MRTTDPRDDHRRGDGRSARSTGRRSHGTGIKNSTSQVSSDVDAIQQVFEMTRSNLNVPAPADHEHMIALRARELARWTRVTSGQVVSMIRLPASFQPLAAPGR